MSTPQRIGRPKTRPAQRPLWLTVVLIFVAMLVLFGVGFGIATLFKGSGGADVADAMRENGRALRFRASCQR